MSTGSMLPDNILEVKNLVTEFRNEDTVTQAVKGINFDLRKGEVLGIVGESGSGKSVTSLSILGLVPDPPGRVAEGEINFRSPTMGEVDLTKVSNKQLRAVRGNEISMIFQEPMTSLNPVFTCGEQVMEAILEHEKISKKEARERTIDLFNQVRLPRPESIFKSYPHELSGGQKQRVMIAMAISCNPSILIADEPTTALDVTVQKTILELMYNLREERDMSIIFITHDLGVIAEFADFVLVMYQGKLVEYGPVDLLFEDPRHPYTKGLLACRPPVDYRMKRLPVIPDFMTTDQEEMEERSDISVKEIIQKNKQTKSDYLQRQVQLAEADPILEVKRLVKHYPLTRNLFGKVTSWVRAVDDVSFRVFKGETLGLVGESGCGKTTLGRTILRLLEPDKGEVIYDGKVITDMTDQEMRKMRRNMQIIFQDPYSSLNPRVTIGNAIMEPMKVHGLYDTDKRRKEKVFDLLSQVSLEPEHFNRYPHQFSGGQRQRVCIARALAVRPDFIICDESVSALDVSVQAQVLNLLNDLKSKYNLTYIFISHDLSVVKFMSDRMLVMNEGRIEEMGYAESIYHNPESEYTKTLIDAIPKGEIHKFKNQIGIGQGG